MCINAFSIDTVVPIGVLTIFTTRIRIEEHECGSLRPEHHSYASERHRRGSWFFFFFFATGASDSDL